MMPMPKWTLLAAALAFAALAGPAASQEAAPEEPAAEEPAAEEPAAEEAAPEEPAAEEPAAEEPAEEPAAQEAAPEESAAEEPAAEEPVAEEAAPEEPAAADETEDAATGAEGEEPAEGGTEDPAAGAEGAVPAEGEAPAEVTVAPEEATEEEAPEAAEDEEATGEGHVIDYDFEFEGPFGSFDQATLQRGLQVYTQVCSACHGLEYVPIRTLGDPGGPALPEDQVRAYAETLIDPVSGEPLTPVDNFPAGQVENAPDLSLMAKARAGFHGPYGTGLSQLVNGMGGAEYIASLLTGYTGEEREEAGVILYENTAYGGYFAMPMPLFGDDVVYEDGTEATVEQMAQDVAAFLMWTAEPKMMARKQAGLTAVLFLGILAVLLYLTNRQLWRPIKGEAVGTRSPTDH